VGAGKGLRFSSTTERRHVVAKSLEDLDRRLTALEARVAREAELRTAWRLHAEGQSTLTLKLDRIDSGLEVLRETQMQMMELLRQVADGAGLSEQVGPGGV
jgi:hypothetical protein